jgi:hypothetical protein
MRQIITKLFYLCLTEMIALFLVVFPVYAFQVSSSSTGFVRVATLPAIATYQVAQRSAFVTAVASAAAAPTLASVAVRVATGPVGWAALGLSVALTLAQMYYTSNDIQAVKTAASPVNSSQRTYSYLGQTYTASGWIATNPNSGCISGTMYFFSGTNQSSPPPSPGMFSPSISGWWCFPSQEQQGVIAPTQQQVIDYLNTLTPGNANAPESHTTPVGQGVNTIPADNVTTLPVSPTDVVPTVKPAAQVLPTDAVIEPNAPPPAEPQPVTTTPPTTTTTTTTTTNPDGSTTQTETEAPATMSCLAGNHDQRTFGTVLQDHLTKWQGSGLVSALNLIKNLTWPETLPTFTLASGIFCSFTLDFTAWSGMLLALRGLIIAVASFVAYRIIFVGSK